MDGTNEVIEQLIALIDKKSELFHSIMDITLEQKKDIEENKANNIQELVERKQHVIDKINEIDGTFSEKLNLLKKNLNVNTMEEVDIAKYPAMKNIKLKVEEIMSMAQEIMQIEMSNKEKLSSMINELKKEMKQISVGKKSLKAYEPPVLNNDGIYIDKKK